MNYPPHHSRRLSSHLISAVVAAMSVATLGPAPLTAQPTQPVRAPAARDSTRALGERLERVMARPEFKHAMFGVAFYSLDDDRMTFAYNADKLFQAASTTKTLTVGTALRLLGADYRFHTRVFATAPVAADGTLRGDLVLVASGDPNLSGRVIAGDKLAFENEDHSYDAQPETRAVPGDPLLVIRALAAQVAAKGVKRITGHVLIDATLFPEGERELGTGVVISPVIVNDNLVDVTIGPGASAGAPTSVTVSPATSYVRFINTSTTAPAGARPSITWSADSAGPGSARVVTVGGVFPLSTPAILYSYAVPQPSRFAQVTFVQALKEKGITAELSPPEAQRDFKGSAASYLPERLMAEHVSPPFAEEAKVTLKVSQNLHASALPFILKAVLAKRDTGKTAFDLEREFLQSAGLDLGGAQQSDGAGGDAAFSPDFMVHYLAYQAKQPYFDAFHRAMPVLGRDGTLFNIQTGSPAAGHVNAKTGTLNRYDALNRKLLVTAKGLAGYLTTANGRRYALAIYVNNVAVSLDPDATRLVAGQAMGEIAAAGYATLP
ncbi:MAG: D-alanyl-D-alanine carboxypeptidase/D-alanyl-D-alanine-endopeptidase [Gemmatimonadota bacterium]|nr:D-alanyl-D-alanine carboxypeptidase/D-alanyl-D-alanine-endopeptidase [Gemmatimonadota bacterium]